MANTRDGVDGCEDRAAGLDLKAIQVADLTVAAIAFQAPTPVSYTHLTLPTKLEV